MVVSIFKENPGEDALCGKSKPFFLNPFLIIELRGLRVRTSLTESLGGEVAGSVILFCQ